MTTLHTSATAARSGERLSNSSAPREYGTGRHCDEDGCGVLLSRYNSTKWCARHESSWFTKHHPPLTDATRIPPVAP
jgi:hypothetical protein